LNVTRHLTLKTDFVSTEVTMTAINQLRKSHSRLIFLHHTVSHTRWRSLSLSVSKHWTTTVY